MDIKHFKSYFGNKDFYNSFCHLRMGPVIKTSMHWQSKVGNSFWSSLGDWGFWIKSSNGLDSRPSEFDYRCWSNNEIVLVFFQLDPTYFWLKDQNSQLRDQKIQICVKGSWFVSVLSIKFNHFQYVLNFSI